MNPDRSERHSNSFKVFMIPVFRDYVSAGSYCFLVEDITSKREKKNTKLFCEIWVTLQICEGINFPLSGQTVVNIDVSPCKHISIMTVCFSQQGSYLLARKSQV